jgi:MORN repeat
VFLIRNENFAYCGQWKDKKPNGFGIQLHFKPKYFYEGESVQGLPHGRGRKIL